MSHAPSLQLYPIWDSVKNRPPTPPTRFQFPRQTMLFRFSNGKPLRRRPLLFMEKQFSAPDKEDMEIVLCYTVCAYACPPLLHRLKFDTVKKIAGIKSDPICFETKKFFKCFHYNKFSANY